MGGCAHAGRTSPAVSFVQCVGSRSSTGVRRPLRRLGPKPRLAWAVAYAQVWSTQPANVSLVDGSFSRGIEQHQANCTAVWFVFVNRSRSGLEAHRPIAKSVKSFYAGVASAFASKCTCRRAHFFCKL